MSALLARLLGLLLVLLLSGVHSLTWAFAPIPELEGRVMDLANLLAPNEEALLTQKLEAVEQAQGAQVAILTVPTTKPEDIAAYSIRVVDQWQLGRAGIDDGVLLLVARDDRRIRIEVGYGLEGAIPDAIAKRIISQLITPEFRQGDFFAGIDAGAKAIVAKINGEDLPLPKRESGESKDGAETNFGLLFFLIIFLSPLSARLLGRVLGPASLATVAAVFSWIVTGSLLFASFVALFAFIAGFAGKGGSVVHRGGGGLGRSGGFGRGGGFSGGGGGFGGGGASGGW